MSHDEQLVAIVKDKKGRVPWVASVPGLDPASRRNREAACYHSASDDC